MIHETQSSRSRNVPVLMMINSGKTAHQRAGLVKGLPRPPPPPKGRTNVPDQQEPGGGSASIYRNLKRVLETSWRCLQGLRFHAAHSDGQVWVCLSQLISHPPTPSQTGGGGGKQTAQLEGCTPARETSPSHRWDDEVSFTVHPQPQKHVPTAPTTLQNHNKELFI